MALPSPRRGCLDRACGGMGVEMQRRLTRWVRLFNNPVALTCPSHRVSLCADSTSAIAVERLGETDAIAVCARLLARLRGNPVGAQL